MNATDARTIAVRLGIDETNVRRLQARGYLLSLSFDEREIRALLLLAHCAYLAAAGARRPNPVPDRVVDLKNRKLRVFYG